jgi:hypothetical protein
MRQPSLVSNNQSPFSHGSVQLICTESGSTEGQAGPPGTSASCWANAVAPANCAAAINSTEA